MPLGVPELLRRRMAAALLPYMASTSVAVATELGIHAEAALRAHANRAGAVPATPRSPSLVRDREVSEHRLVAEWRGVEICAQRVLMWSTTASQRQNTVGQRWTLPCHN